MRRAAVVPFALVAALVAVPSAAAEPFVLEATGSRQSLGKVTAIGDLRPQRDPSLAAATFVFGRPSRTVQTSGASCRVLWRSIGLRISFVNLGGGGPCTPRFTSTQVVRAYGSRWRTGRGLGVGDGRRRLRRLYPRATRHGRSWWLVRGVNIFGFRDNPYPVLRATMGQGRVRSFALNVGAGGE